MDRDVAEIFAATANRASREIGYLARFLKEHGDQATPELQDAIGAIVFDIHEHLLGPVFAEHPDLKAESEGRLEKFGVAFP